MPENASRILEMNESLVREIDVGIFTTFSTMFGLSPKPGQHTFSDECVVKGDISGFVSLTQARVEGMLVISFPQETIFAILSKMYRKQFTEVDKSVRSGVGELTNIVFGVMKTNLNKNGFELKMAIPNVIFGSKHSILGGSEGNSVSIPYTTEVGQINVHLTLFKTVERKSA